MPKGSSASSAASVTPSTYGSLFNQGVGSALSNITPLAQGDINAANALLPSILKQQNQNATGTAKSYLGVQNQYAPALTALETNDLKSTDPGAFALRSNLENNLNNDVSSGYSLGPTLQRELSQDIEGAQAARGNVLGNADAQAEALNTGQFQIGLYNQRMQNAQNYLNGNQVASQLGNTPLSPYNTGQTSSLAGISPGLSSGAGGVAYGQNIFDSQEGYAQQANNATIGQGNPYLQGAGALLGLGGTIAGSVFGGPAGGAAGGAAGSALASTFSPSSSIFSGSGGSGYSPLSLSSSSPY